MTNIKITDTKTYKAFYITGHTDKTVCAGVSAIIQGLIGWLQNNRQKVSDLSIKLEAGKTSVFFQTYDEGAKAVFDMAVIAFLQIELGYPEHIKIEH